MLTYIWVYLIDTRGECEFLFPLNPGITSLKFPFPPVAFINSCSLPVKRECDFSISLPVSGSQKALPAHPLQILSIQEINISSFPPRFNLIRCDQAFTYNNSELSVFSTVVDHRGTLQVFHSCSSLFKMLVAETRGMELNGRGWEISLNNCLISKSEIPRHIDNHHIFTLAPIPGEDFSNDEYICTGFVFQDESQEGDLATIAYLWRQTPMLSQVTMILIILKIMIMPQTNIPKKSRHMQRIALV